MNLVTVFEDIKVGRLCTLERTDVYGTSLGNCIYSYREPVSAMMFLLFQILNFMY